MLWTRRSGPTLTLATKPTVREPRDLEPRTSGSRGARSRQPDNRTTRRPRRPFRHPVTLSPRQSVSRVRRRTTCRRLLEAWDTNNWALSPSTFPPDLTWRNRATGPPQLGSFLVGRFICVAVPISNTNIAQRRHSRPCPTIPLYLLSTASCHIYPFLILTSGTPPTTITFLFQSSAIPPPTSVRSLGFDTHRHRYPPQVPPGFINSQALDREVDLGSSRHRLLTGHNNHKANRPFPHWGPDSLTRVDIPRARKPDLFPVTSRADPPSPPCRPIRLKHPRHLRL